MNVLTALSGTQRRKNVKHFSRKGLKKKPPLAETMV
jgi:hypothetical protein